VCVNQQSQEAEECGDGCNTQNLNQNKCSDNTDFNKCSSTKPKFCNNGILINRCDLCGCANNGECQEDNSCISKPPVIQSNNLTLVDIKPIFSFIPSITLNQDQSNLNNLILLTKYAKDPKNKNLDFSFRNKQKTFTSDIIDCFIDKDKFGCNKPKKSGNLELTIFASNGIKESSSKFVLKILPKIIPKTKNIVGGKSSGNKAPIANAGEDKTMVVGSSIVLDASKSYDEDDNLISDPSNYLWYENGQQIGKGINLKTEFSLGIHKITLQIVDAEGLSSTDTLTINVISKEKCKETKTIYFPQDTICNKKWPSQEGEILNVNSIGYSCNLVEVCNEDLDPIIADSIDCCDGTPIIEDNSKVNACSFANKYSNQNTKRCQALYLINSLGANSIYMKDYFELEMCCKGVTELCENQKYLYSARPLPKTGKDLSKLRCNNNPDNNPPGEWISDSRIDLNNIALQDVPTHVSLEILSSGTCVDYSFSLTTLLRKIGYKQDEIYTVEGSNHAYNLIKLPLDKKYTFVDTTGNNNPAIIFGKIPMGYEYCENMQKCYNDNGELLCPGFDEIYGCENVKQDLTQKSKIVGFKTGKFIDKIINLIKTEIER
jgi:hypothetical protein